MKAAALALVVCAAFVMNAHSQAPINLNNLKIRVERPDRIREPQAQTSSNCFDGKDNPFNEIEISTGTFYGYTANGSKSPSVASTCFMKGNQPFGMQATSPGFFGPTIYPSNHYDSSAGWGSCGLWLQGTYKSGTTYYGFAHAEGFSSAFPSERQCTYPPTTKSMGLLTSSDGLNWSLAGQIISNPNGSSTEFGEGDCSPAPFGSFLYLYCRRTSDFKSSVARAPITSDFTAANWIKYNGSWSPGAAWNADDSSIGSLGNSASIFVDSGSGNQNIMLMDASITSAAHGLLMSFSNDSNGVSFSSVPEPVLYEDDHTFPHASVNGDLVVYPAAISPADGSNIWGADGYFLFTYTYVPNQNDSGAQNSPAPAPDFGRTLVMRNLSVSVATSPQTPHVGVAISRWRNPDISLRISSTEAVPYNFVTSNLVYETRSGYIMTEPPTSDATEIWECVNKTWPSTTNPDHTLTFPTSTECTGTSAGYTFLRTAGWLYSSHDAQPPNTLPVYRCKSTAAGYATDTHFASTSSTCEGLGTMEFLLGYGLAN